MGLSACSARPTEPVPIAAFDGDVAGLKDLLASGAPADAFGKDGLTPLMWAARKGRVETMKILLDAGARIDRRDVHFWGWTPMIHAIHKAQTEAVQLLIERGADVNAAANNGLTPLIDASGECDCQADRSEKDLDAIVTLLLENGADPRSETLDHFNALMSALASGRAGVVKALRERAPDLEVHPNLEFRASLLINRLVGRSKSASK
jgi:ankyrin repeat protein